MKEHEVYDGVVTIDELDDHWGEIVDQLETSTFESVPELAASNDDIALLEFEEKPSRLHDLEETIADTICGELVNETDDITLAVTTTWPIRRYQVCVL